MTKQPMPSERSSVTRKLKIGELEGYVTVGFYEDGKPGEVFLVIQKSGTLERGLSHALALVISLALQHGVPLKAIAEKLKDLSFEPRGFTGCQDIPSVNSVADYLGKWFLQRICKDEPKEGSPV